MPKVAQIGPSLERTLWKSGMRQKELAVDTKTPNATLSDHVQGANVKVEKAIEYMEALKDDDFTGAVSYEYLGFLKSMDGQLAQVKSVNDLEIFQVLESNERKERRQQAQIIIAQSQVRPLDEVEKSHLRAYSDEFLDEIIVELSIVFSLQSILGITIQQAIVERMPHWIEKKYMKG